MQSYVVEIKIFLLSYADLGEGIQLYHDNLRYAMMMVR